MFFPLFFIMYVASAGIVEVRENAFMESFLLPLLVFFNFIKLR